MDELENAVDMMMGSADDAQELGVARVRAVPVGRTGSQKSQLHSALSSVVQAPSATAAMKYAPTAPSASGMR